MTAMQRSWYITVRDQGSAGFSAEANYVDTLTDQTLILEIERKSLIIKNALLEIRRGQPGVAAITPIPALIGITAYFGSGKQLRQALEVTLLDMATQTFTAVIQAEAFFYQERGFHSAKEYDDFWDEKSANSCVYYSNLDLVEKRFMEYIKDHQKGNNLFHRFLLTSLDSFDEKAEIRSYLMDSFHEMTLNLELDLQAFKIRKVAGSMLRCPDSICLKALESLENLKGMPLTTENLRSYNNTNVRGSACTHMTHLVQEAACILNQYKLVDKG